jgi:hypothetical protein
VIGVCCPGFVIYRMLSNPRVPKIMLKGSLCSTSERPIAAHASRPARKRANPKNQPAFGYDIPPPRVPRMCDGSGAAVDGATTREPMLVLPPALTQRTLAALIASGCVARHWQHGGRYGSRIATDDQAGEEPVGGQHGFRPRRTIPVLPSAAAHIAACLEQRGDCGAGLSPELRLLLRSGEVSLECRPVTQPRMPRDEPFDATVHPERRPAGFELASVVATVSTTAAAPGGPGFTFAELYAGIGGFGCGLEAIGGRCVFASEVSPSCVAVYGQNFPLAASAVNGDIWKVRDCDIPKHEILVRPPQPAARGGARRSAVHAWHVHSSHCPPSMRAGGRLPLSAVLCTGEAARTPGHQRRFW